jgi:succinoglycan biosynthesis transport protein ExoP
MNSENSSSGFDPTPRDLIPSSLGRPLTVRMEESRTAPAPSLQEYIALFRRRRAIVLYTFVFVTVLGAIMTLLTRPTYRATAFLLVDPPSYKLSQVDASNPLSDLFSGGQQYKVETQVRLLLSQEINRTMAARLKKEGADGPMPQMQVKAVRDTDIIQVDAEGPDPRRAAQAANTLLYTYIDEVADADGRQLRDGLAFTEAGIKKAQSDLERAEKAQRDFKRRYNVTDLDTTRAAQITAADKLSTDYDTFRSQRDSVRSKIVATRQQLTHQPRIEPGFIPEADPLLQATEGQIGSLEAQRQALLARYTPANAQVIAVATQIQVLQNRMNEQRKTASRRSSRLNPAYDLLRNRLDDLQTTAMGLEAQITATRQQLAPARARLSQYPSWELEMARLQRQLDLARSNYALFSTKREDLRLRLQTRRVNARIMDQATPPTAPVRPRRFNNMLIAAFLGALLGLCLALLQEYLDDRINSVEEANRLSLLPNLVTIPAVTESDLRLAHKMKGFSPLLEAFRGLRTSITFASVDNAVRTLAVTSSMPGEGKSTITLNLAVAMAMDGKRVIVVDGDLRRPTIHKLLGISQVPGLSDVLIGTHTLSQAIRETGVAGLRVITAGSHAPNPAELLGSDSMARFIESVSAAADIVLFDSSPALAVADSMLLTSQLDGALFVIGAGEVRRASVRQALELLFRSRVRLLGTVLNKMNSTHGGYYSAHYYGSQPSPGTVSVGEMNPTLEEEQTLIPSGAGSRDNQREGQGQ